MTVSVKNIVVTGAAGFIGSRVVERLLTDKAYAEAQITVCDLRLSSIPENERLRRIEGDFGDPSTLEALQAGRPDLVFHLAGVLGGAAEIDYDLSRRVNLDATLSLFETLRDPKRPPRVVFASSIAVFGPPLPERIDDDSLPLPVMNYGAHKRMMEVALEQFSARGWIDGVAIRLPGIVARRGADARLKSAFLNTMFYAYAASEDIELPVSPEGTIWLISVPACVEAFIHAARIPTEALGHRRAFTLPAQRISMTELVAGLAERFPESRSTVRYVPDPDLEALFTRQPPLTTAIGESLGFRHDGSLAALVQRAII